MANKPNYRIVNAASKTVGSVGGQVLLGRVMKIDAQSIPNGYLHGIKISAMLNEAEQDQAGLFFYLTTSPAWSDDYIITAAATPGGPSGSCYLSAKRYIRTNATPDTSNDIAQGTGGMVYLWIEAGDYLASESVRYVAETWGRNVEFIEM